MPISGKPEFPPLLPSGFHALSLSDLRQLCIAAEFAQSTTRSSIMAGLGAVLRRLVETRIIEELWVDGSFLTKKIDPEDVDLLLREQAQFCDNATSEQGETLEWFEKGLKGSFRCDSYVWREYHVGHALHPLSEAERTYWTKWFRQSRNGHPKGVAVLAIPDGAL